MKISRKFILGDYTLNSHDHSDGLIIDITRRNFYANPLLGLKGLKECLLECIYIQHIYIYIYI